MANEELAISGADQLTVLAARLKDEADRGISRELSAGLLAATKPMRAAARRNARDVLPATGGLNKEMARSKMTVVRRYTGHEVGVRIGTASHDPRIDAGRLRHPVFGNREVWVQQTVPAEWFTRPMEESAPLALIAVDRTMRHVVDRVEGL